MSYAEELYFLSDELVNLFNQFPLSETLKAPIGHYSIFKNNETNSN